MKAGRHKLLCLLAAGVQNLIHHTVSPGGSSSDHQHDGLKLTSVLTTLLRSHLHITPPQLHEQKHKGQLHTSDTTAAGHDMAVWGALPAHPYGRTVREHEGRRAQPAQHLLL